MAYSSFASPLVTCADREAGVGNDPFPPVMAAADAEGHDSGSHHSNSDDPSSACCMADWIGCSSSLI
jgi:hypothetical protein